jgi:serine-type D-Ala-D-Ala carboxypeptidase/endopeptidase
MKWHLDRFGKDGAEARVLDHALYVPRDGLRTVSGLDHAGHMVAMGLAWIGMMPRDDRPFILQKAGGLQGEFSYIAFAPTRNAAVFVSINKFDFAAGIEMGDFANDLLATIAPR